MQQFNDQPNASRELQVLNNQFGAVLHSQLTDLSEASPIVMFLDGEGVTKNHKEYHLLDLSYMRAMEKAVQTVCEGMDMEYLALLDEISIIFTVPTELLQQHHYRYHDEVTGFFVQEFQEAFTFPVPVRFHVKAYNIPQNSVPQFFEWRRLRSEQALYQYIAKEYLPPKLYYAKSTEELKQMLSQKMLLNDTPELRIFLNGLSGNIESDQEFYVPESSEEEYFFLR